MKILGHIKWMYNYNQLTFGAKQIQYATYLGVNIFQSKFGVVAENS